MGLDAVASSPCLAQRSARRPPQSKERVVRSASQEEVAGLVLSQRLLIWEVQTAAEATSTTSPRVLWPDVSPTVRQPRPILTIERKAPATPVT